MATVIAIGECMVELSLEGPAAKAVQLSYAGDVFNTAVYLRRLGHSVSFVTALGAGDPFSAAILNLMAAEDLDASLVARVPGRLPGLYAIERDAHGERRFFYWREEAPVRQLFDLADLSLLQRALEAADMIYLSGVTLAVLGASGRATVLERLGEARRRGAVIAFDPNYRTSLWSSPDAARESLEAIAPHCRFLSVSSPDVEALYGAPLAQVADAWSALGVEVIARHDDHSVSIHTQDGVACIPPAPAVRAIDTTGAGDSFNGGYLATRLSGGDTKSAVGVGRRLAAAVVQHVGAILPIAEMPLIETG